MLYLPKCVLIVNWRLQLLFYTLGLITFIVLTVRFFVWRQWVYEVLPTGRVYLWPHGFQDIYRSTADEVLNKARNSDICRNAASYEYWWDVDGAWRYGPHECVTLCSKNESVGSNGSYCIHTQESYIQEASNQVMFVTEFSEEFLGVEGEEHFYFVPIESALSLGLDYSFSVQELRWLSPDRGDELHYDSASDVRTILLNSNKEQVDVFHVGRHIIIGIPMLLELVGKSMDSFHDEAGVNKNPDAGEHARRGPLVRIAGLELRMMVTCRKRAKYPYEQIKDWDGPICAVSVHSTATWWAGKQVLDVVRNGTDRLRKYHGIRISVVLTGGWEQVDLNNLLLNISSFIVFMSVPARIVLFICVNLLGHLSTLYSQALYERMDVVEQCAGMAARLMSMSTAFVELQDSEDLDKPEMRGISRNMVKERLLEVFRQRSDVISQSEVERFTDLCFHTMVVYNRERSRQPSQTWVPQLSLAALRQKMSSLQVDRARQIFLARAMSLTTRTRHVEQASARDVITIDDFATAHASIENFEFKAIVKLFCKTHKMQILERFFLPFNIRTCLEVPDADKRLVSEAQSVSGSGLSEDSVVRNTIDTQAECVRLSMMSLTLPEVDDVVPELPQDAEPKVSRLTQCSKDDELLARGESSPGPPHVPAITDLMKKSKRSRAESKSLTLEEKRHKILNAYSKVAALQETHEQAREEWEAQARTFKAQIRTLEDNVQSSQKEAESLAARVHELETALAASQAAQSSAQAQVVAMTSVFDMSQRELASLTGQVKSLWAAMSMSPPTQNAGTGAAISNEKRRGMGARSSEADAPKASEELKLAFDESRDSTCSVVPMLGTASHRSTSARRQHTKTKKAGGRRSLSEGPARTLVDLRGGTNLIGETLLLT